MRWNQKMHLTTSSNSQTIRLYRQSHRLIVVQEGNVELALMSPENKQFSGLISCDQDRGFTVL